MSDDLSEILNMVQSRVSRQLDSVVLKQNTSQFAEPDELADLQNVERILLHRDAKAASQDDMTRTRNDSVSGGSLHGRRQIGDGSR